MNIRPLRPLGVQGIYESIGSTNCEFKSWIANGKYQVSSISQSSDIDLYINDSESLIETLGYDLSRFACASFESMHSIAEAESFPKATAWAGIKSYYAAFFSAHALLRYFGSSCSQIEAAQINLLNKYASIYGANNKAQSGFYFAKYDPTTKNLRLKKLNDTHKDTWDSFKDATKAISLAILQCQGLSSDLANISSIFSSLSDTLTDSGKYGAGNWLSVFRNNLNYRQDYQAWYPYKKQSIKFNQINKYIKDWGNAEFNPTIGLLEKDERVRFFGTCSAIVHITHQIAKDLAIVAQKNSVHRNRTNAFICLTKK